MIKVRFSVVLLCVMGTVYANSKLVDSLHAYIPLPQKTYARLCAWEDEQVTQSPCAVELFQTSLPLFQSYPVLQQQLPYVSLAQLPTPISTAEQLSTELNLPTIYIKGENYTGLMLPQGLSLAGGNKLRKLGFLFGRALALGARTVMTFGCAGSNHAVSTAACARHLGLKSIVMLLPQYNMAAVQQNLKLMHHYGADMCLSPNVAVRSMAAVYKCCENKYMQGDFPYVIPTGGSNAVGSLGYVNAAFELKQQIEQGVMPEPDYIYLAAGSFGTAAGLLLGLQAAELKSKVICVAIEPEKVAGSVAQHITELFSQTNQLLHGLDATFGLYQLRNTDFTVVTDFSGKGYGIPSEQGQDAQAVALELAQMPLDSTYAAKAFACLLHDAALPENQDKTFLFFNTYYCPPAQLTDFNYTQLKPAFYSYFQEN